MFTPISNPPNKQPRRRPSSVAFFSPKRQRRGKARDGEKAISSLTNARLRHWLTAFLVPLLSSDRLPTPPTAICTTQQQRRCTRHSGRLRSQSTQRPHWHTDPCPCLSPTILSRCRRTPACSSRTSGRQSSRPLTRSLRLLRSCCHHLPLPRLLMELPLSKHTTPGRRRSVVRTLASTRPLT